MNIKEDFLQYIWQSLKFDLLQLVTTTGESITLLDNGYLNTNAGPDFINGRIKIDDILWVGSIEIHIRSDDWYKHNHHLDERYDNVILHVVFEENTPVKDRQGRRIPCLELKNRIAGEVWRKYKLFQSQKHPVACFNQLQGVPLIYRTSALEKGVTQRLVRKAKSFDQILIKKRQRLGTQPDHSTIPQLWCFR
jgi:ribosomal protein S17E